MNEARPGARLAGRYRLTERLAESPDDSTWLAVDATLDRQVQVWLLRPGHPRADEVLDAARRVALVDDRRLVRVLTVGTDSGTLGERAFVITEHVTGRTLETLAADGGLPAPAARRVAGEVAEGLAAGGRGVHHLKLTPRLVTVTPAGAVKIAGLATLAAAAGLEPGHATRANRVDALATVGVLYFALTGAWPLGDAGFPPARRSPDGPAVPPRDLVPGVPEALDELCTQTLAGEGPVTPGEVALRLDPWLSAAQAKLVTDAQPATAPPAPKAVAVVTAAPEPQPGPTTDAPADERGVTQRPPGERGVTPHPEAEEAPEPEVAPVGAPAAEAQTDTDDVPPDDETADETDPDTPQLGLPVAPRPEPEQDPEEKSGPKPAAQQRFRPAPPMPPPMPSSTGFGGSSSGLRPGLGPVPKPPEAPRDVAPREPARPAAAAAAAPDSGLRTQTPPQPIRPPAVRVNGTTTGPRPAPNTPGGGRGLNGLSLRHANGHPPVTASGEQLLPWANTWARGDDTPSTVESTGPFPLVLPQQAPPAEQSRRVVVGVAVAVVLVLLVAGLAVRGLIGGGPGANPGVVVPTAATGASASPSSAAPTSAAPTSAVPTPPVADRPRIAAIRAVDPQGDGDESTSTSPKAVDGQDDTFWASETYASAKFGGLKKGIGLSIRLKDTARISSVEVDAHGSGGTVQLRLGPTADPSDAKVVDTAKLDGGTTTLSPEAASEAKYVILWFTALPRTSDGYRAEVAEVRVT